jgi:hypothetical protein
VSGGLLVIAMTTRPLHCGISSISAETKRKKEERKTSGKHLKRAKASRFIPVIYSKALRKLHIGYPIVEACTKCLAFLSTGSGWFEGVFCFYLFSTTNSFAKQDLQERNLKWPVSQNRVPTVALPSSNCLS